MPTLSVNNCSIQKDSGAVIFHKSPELLEIMKLRKEIRDLQKSLDLILSALKQGGEINGSNTMGR